MRLDIEFLNNGYVSTEKSIPVVVKLSSEKETEMAEKIDLKEIMLRQGDVDKVGAYTTCRLGLPNDTFILSKQRPHYILYDICDGCEDVDIEPGDYEVSIKLEVFMKVGQEAFEKVKLEGRRKITIE